MIEISKELIEADDTAVIDNTDNRPTLGESLQDTDIIVADDDSIPSRSLDFCTVVFVWNFSTFAARKDGI